MTGELSQQEALPLVIIYYLEIIMLCLIVIQTLFGKLFHNYLTLEYMQMIFLYGFVLNSQFSSLLLTFFRQFDLFNFSFLFNVFSRISYCRISDNSPNTPELIISQYKNCSFLQNFGQYIFLWMTVLGIYIILKVVARMATSQLHVKLFGYLITYFENNTIYDLLWLSHLSMFFFAFLQLNSFDNSAQSIVELALGLLLNIIIYIMLIILIKKLINCQILQLNQLSKVVLNDQEIHTSIKQQQSQLASTNKPDINNNNSFLCNLFKQFCEGQNANSPCQLAFNFLLVFRGHYTALVLALLGFSHPKLTMWLTLLQHIMILIWQALKRPYTRKIINIQIIISEVLFCLSNILMLATLYNGEDKENQDIVKSQYILGWAVIISLSFIMCIHLVLTQLYTTAKLFLNIYIKIKNKRNQKILPTVLVGRQRSSSQCMITASSSKEQLHDNNVVSSSNHDLDNFKQPSEKKINIEKLIMQAKSKQEEKKKKNSILYSNAQMIKKLNKFNESWNVSDNQSGHSSFDQNNRKRSQMKEASRNSMQEASRNQLDNINIIARSEQFIQMKNVLHIEEFEDHRRESTLIPEPDKNTTPQNRQYKNGILRNSIFSNNNANRSRDQLDVNSEQEQHDSFDLGGQKKTQINRKRVSFQVSRNDQKSNNQ